MKQMKLIIIYATICGATFLEPLDFGSMYIMTRFLFIVCLFFEKDSANAQKPF